MDRRDFIALTAMAATGGAVMPSEALAKSLSALRALADPGLAAQEAGQGGDNRRAAVKITSEFMEDYTPGRPWGLSFGQIGFASQPAPYVAKDQSLQFFTTFHDTTGDQRQHPVSRLFPAPDGITGWNVQQEMSPAEVHPAYMWSGWPQPVILKGAGNQADKLLIYRGYSLQSTNLGQDGTMYPLKVRTWTVGSTPLVPGPLAPGTRYMPEHAEWPDPSVMNYPGERFALARRPAYARNSYYLLRDLQHPAKAHFAADDAFSYQKNGADIGWENVKIFPLKGAGEGHYRCIALSDQGDVFGMGLSLDTYHGVFTVTSKSHLGRSPINCVYVHEETSGHVEVLIFDLPQVTTVTGDFPPENGGGNSVELFTDQGRTAEFQVGVAPAIPSAPKGTSRMGRVFSARVVERARQETGDVSIGTGYALSR